jgi:D-lactate dehydrogenase
MPAVTVFSTEPYDKKALSSVGEVPWSWHFIEESLTPESAWRAEGSEAVSAFVGDSVDRSTLETLHQMGVRMVALRSIGYDQVDRAAAREMGIQVSHIPTYTSYAVAEYAVLMILALLRHLKATVAKVEERDFSLAGLEGRLLHQRVVGLIGCGHIGSTVAAILRGFGAKVLVFDPYLLQERGEEITGTLEDLLDRAEILSLHCPLTEGTRYLLNREALSRTKRGVVIVNTSRGGLIDTSALEEALRKGHVAGAALDVFEREKGVFHRDCRQEIVDPQLLRLIEMDNVLVTPHAAFLTEEALKDIATALTENLRAFFAGKTIPNLIPIE